MGSTQQFSKRQGGTTKKIIQSLTPMLIGGALYPFYSYKILKYLLASKILFLSTTLLLYPCEYLNIKKALKFSLFTAAL